MNLYFVRMTGRDDYACETFYKIGITNHKDIMSRFHAHAGQGLISITKVGMSRLDCMRLAMSGYLYRHPYNVEVIISIPIHDEDLACLLEECVKQLLSEDRLVYSPKIKFSGHTECFRTTDSDLTDIIRCVKEIVKERDMR